MHHSLRNQSDMMNGTQASSDIEGRPIGLPVLERRHSLYLFELPVKVRQAVISAVIADFDNLDIGFDQQAASHIDTVFIEIGEKRLVHDFTEISGKILFSHVH